MRILRTLFSIGLLGLFFSSVHAQAIQVDSDGLYDVSGSVNQETKTLLRTLNRAYEQTEPKPQIAMVVLEKADDLEKTATELYRQIGLGSREKNNGVLLLFTMDRRVRIEVGYGLEGAIPDAVAGRIIREAPGLDLNTKAQFMLRALNERIVHEYHLQDQTLQNLIQHDDGPSFFLFLIFFFLIVLFLFGSGRGRGGCRGVWPWILIDLLMPRSGRGGFDTFNGRGGFGGGGRSGGGGASGRW